MKRIMALLLAMIMVLGLFGCTTLPDVQVSVPAESIVQTIPQASVLEETVPETTEPIETELQAPLIDIDGWYYSAEDVALYLVTFGCLPENFITKQEAREMGWEGGSVERFAPGYAIGGDKFRNWEGLLPMTNGRQYYECDIDTNGRSSRGAKRLVFSNDGLIFYTEDHYASFILLYGEDFS